jgi:tetratricopeptide (TPR) repeat protein
MANYLVLHIDMEFVAGVVCTGNGRFFPVRNGNEDFLWLYFFNDPYHNKVSFGKDNKKHFNNLDLNYYGDFFNHIIDENSKFTIRGIERPAIELLEYSGLLKLLIAKYKEKSFTDSPEIPTLITFSSTISQPARKMIVAYLSSKNFKIKSHLIPLPELISVYYNKLKMDNGNLVLFLKATNSTLHFMKLHFIDEYFLNDESVQVSFRGRGYDPRKKAITKFVVSEVNSSTARISNPDEIEKECDRFESTSDEWLRRVDATTDNRQVFINGVSLSTTPNMRRQVLVRKADIENDTWYYINELSDLYNTFESDNIKDNGKLALVILFGECFKNELIKQKFESLIGSEKLLISSLNKIFDILSIYPEIEFEKYGSAYERIELLKKLQAQNIDNEHVITIRKKAKDYFKEAKELYRIGSIVQAFSFIEKAKELDSSNAEILDFYKLLNEENIKLEVTSRICDEYVAQAKNLEALGKFDDAKKQLELAQEISNTLEIRKLMSKIDKKINELKIIENQEKEKKKALQHYEEAIKLISENNYKDAKRELESALVLDNNSQKISNKLSEVEAWRMLQEKQFTHFIEVAQDFISKKDWDNAEIALKEALKLIPEDADCLAQIR